MSYQIIYADPPWSYRDKLRHHGGGAGSHYPTLTMEEIKNLPVAQGLAADDCALFLWIPGPHLRHGVETVQRWGFEYKTVAFTWVKVNKTVRTKRSYRVLAGAGLSTPFLGLGRWTRGNPEVCLLGIRGRMERKDNSVKELVFSRRRRHSAKPDCVRGRIKRLLGDLPRIELFAREQAPGWDATGFDLDGRDVREFLRTEGGLLL